MAAGEAYLLGCVVSDGPGLASRPPATDNGEHSTSRGDRRSVRGQLRPRVEHKGFRQRVQTAYRQASLELSWVPTRSKHHSTTEPFIHVNRVVGQLPASNRLEHGEDITSQPW